MPIIAQAFHKDIIDKNTWEFLSIKAPRMPTLPKAHKSMDRPPGCSIVSGNGCLTESVSQIVDDYLRPHVMALNSYLQDTTDLLRALNGVVVPEGAWLVTIDVEALYN